MPNLNPSKTVSARVRVKGLVQGVGYRPFVWQLAGQEQLTGTVLNDAEGVSIKVWGRADQIDRFTGRLKTEHPPLARIDEVLSTIVAKEDTSPPETFEIVASADGEVSTGIVPDAATCPACLVDVFQNGDTREGYAFTNCTHCGPRLSIITAIPYDRAKTSMASFQMCPRCQSEYENPADRRFHAQPNACPACGPQLWAEDMDERVDGVDVISWAAKRLKAGDILAIKGLGGFHLAVDATNETAVQCLRARKRRSDKPLALMARNLEQVRKFAQVTEEEATLLSDRAAPIVLLDQKPGHKLADSLAPGQRQMGVMLPYTPLHHLLMLQLDRPIVLTSGNLSEEPQVIDNDEALDKLGGVADGFLMHNRDIINRLDDSVVRLTAEGPMILRRARGYAPAPIHLANYFESAPNVLALGGELKSTFCLLRDGQAIVSQHIGDLEHVLALEDFKKNLALYRDIFRFDPELIAVDSHPDYLSTQLGKTISKELGVPCVEVQHHHAHLASVLADNGISPEDDRSVGIILDGTGYGPDGTIWGGEILVGGYAEFERVGHFQPVPLPGGAAAVKEPWRNLVAHLFSAFGSDYVDLLTGSPLREKLSAKNTVVLHQMMEKKLNAPLSSSAGRLFDAVGAALGVCFERQTYEGEAGAGLETLATEYMAFEKAYPFDLSGSYVLYWRPFWVGLLEDLNTDADPGRIAARFHRTLIEGLASAVFSIACDKNLSRAVLSGGVLQNRLVLEGLTGRLRSKGLTVLVPKNVPANDGGLSLGQATSAAIQGNLFCFK